MMKVSIIVPVYNVENYLEKCLNSLVSQKMDNYEIICVNDASTDRSTDILKGYSQKYANIVVLNNEGNRGLSFTRNRGIFAARGEYLLFVDSDDWLMDENVLSLLYHKAIEGGVALLRYHLSTDKQAVEREYYDTGKNLFSYLTDHNIYRWESVRNFVRRDFLYQCKIFFDEEIYGCEDVLFSTKCICNVEKAGQIPNVLYHYNRHEGSITRGRKTSRNVEGLLRVIDALYIQLGDEVCNTYKYCFISLIQTMIETCKGILFLLDSSLDHRGWSYEMHSLYTNLVHGGTYIRNDILFENWDKLLCADKVYLYGAGRACEEFLNKTRYRIDYSGIIVTQKKEEQKMFRDLQIYDVDDPQIDKEALILICITGKKIQEEVKRTLFFNGFQNILCVAREWVQWEC
jgi:glycosyltransferase involved in cell wall biosynthesis